MKIENLVSSYINDEISVLKSLDKNSIIQVFNTLELARSTMKHVYTIGNGGSASTASHIVNDFGKGINEQLPADELKFNFECLSDNVATITAIANDASYDDIYAVQLEHKIKSGDVLIAISGSGNSTNIVNAVKVAKEAGAVVIGFVGFNGGKLKDMCDVVYHVNVDSMQIVEDLHLMIDHLLYSIYKRVYSD